MEKLLKLKLKIKKGRESSLTAIASRVGITKGHLSNILYGRRKPSKSLMKKISKEKN